jgi:hypothetical protein
MCRLRNINKNVFGKPNQKRLTGRCMFSWEDNIKIDLK